MAQGQLRGVVRFLRGLAGAPALELNDRCLLERFTASRDEDAFTTLVRRHGPLVWGVCQRVLGSRHDAEDAFQATFLVLARKAGAIRWHNSVGSWLYEVAFRLSHEARVKMARRRFHERAAAIPQAAITSPLPADADVYALLDEELHRLPERFRAPLLLCYLQGRTSDQAARELGWSLRTLQRRLAQGRELLRARLTRRGVTLPAVLLLGVLTQSSAGAALPAALAAGTAQAATAFAAGGTMSGTKSALLAQAFLKGMAMTRRKVAAAVVLLLAATAGGGLGLRQLVTASEPTDAALDPAFQKPDAPAAQPAKADADAFANEMWDIMEVIGKQHLQPCPRADMIVAAVRGLLKAADTEPPADLARRAAAIKDRAAFAALLRTLWPHGEKAPPRDKLEEALIEGLSNRIAGKLRVLPARNLQIEEQISGNRYVGVGIQIKHNEKEDRAQVQVAMRNGTARKAGVKADDLIVQVNGKDTKGQKLMTIVDWIRGDEGTKFTLAVKQPGSADLRTYTLTRAKVPFDSLTGYRRASEDAWDYQPDPVTPVAYVRVDSLRISTLQELRQLEPKLRDKGFRALILDLRASSGDGQVRNAALFADGLLDGGVMWAARGADAKDRREYKADRECLFRDWPLAVLIDETLERQHALVAAALQDNRRAVLVGEPTKNDGYVNTLVKLPDGKTGIIFRTGILERAAKERNWPVEPDYNVEMKPKERETRLEWHRKQEIAEKPTGDKPPADPQLARALEVMRDALANAETRKNQ